MAKKTPFLIAIAEAGASAAIKYARDHPEVLDDLKAKGVKSARALRDGKEAVTEALSEKANEIEDEIEELVEEVAASREKKALIVGLMIGAIVAAVAIATRRRD